MPTYEYRCPSGHAFEKVQKITDRTRVKCPECGLPAERQISGGAGLVFKGSGFYITDYGKDGKGPRKPAEEGTSAKPQGKEGGASEGRDQKTSGSAKEKSAPKKAAE